MGTSNTLKAVNAPPGSILDEHKALSYTARISNGLSFDKYCNKIQIGAWPPIYLHSIFPILQLKISSLINWGKNQVQNQLDIFSSSNLIFFSSFWARIKYFEGPCLTISPLFTIYRDIHYQFLVWWIHYTHCCESKKWKPGKFHLCSLWNDIFNYPNWDFWFC